MKKRKIELLSPARDPECGIAAIDHGADAVYIGGPKFGARTAAGNSIDDIASLTNYAHLFNSRIYLTLNTILFDHEIEEAVKLTWDAYYAGVDALIIQDMGLLECELPPLPLHASTQTNNQSAEKVLFLEKVGFKQIVLARELNLQQIKQIYSQTSASLEFFIHGALCVCYSGQCYMSYDANGRSGNRGDCTQMCRHRYTVTDGNGSVIESDKYLLSLKDLNLTQNIEKLIDAGISSFKIEGRLKGPEYVKNLTAHYRKQIDRALANRSDLQHSSSGTSIPGFDPNPEKSFNRSFTSYNINLENNDQSNIYTPKSIGQIIGKVISSSNEIIYIDSTLPVHNGDGLCFFDKNGELKGFRVNKIENNTIFTLPKIKIDPNTILYRNKDVDFEKQVEKSHSCRKIKVDITLAETKDGIELQLKDEQGMYINKQMNILKDTAKEPEKQNHIIEHHLSKLGDSIFTAGDISINLNEPLFIPGKVLNELRREAINELLKIRLANFSKEESKLLKNNYPFPNQEISYTENVANKKAEQFYTRHGVKLIEKAFELQEKIPGQLLMTSKYCIRKQLNLCLMEHPETKRKNDNLYLSDNTWNYRLDFNCDICQMKVYST